MTATGFFRHILFMAACSGMLAAPAVAQSVVGTSVLGGKRVELLSDNTWRFAELPQTDGKCVPINTALTFCGTIFDWRPSRTAGTDFLRVFQHRSNIAAGIIYEELGSADGMDLAFMRNIVIENAASATNVRPEEIPISGVFDGYASDLPSETIAYSARVNTLDVHYRNTIVSSDNHTIQLVVWSIGKEPSEDLPEIAQSFVEAVRITLPEIGK